MRTPPTATRARRAFHSALALAWLGWVGAAAEAEAGNSAPLATAVVTDAAFELELKPVGEYVAGRQATAEVVLTARAPYKVNQKYPYKFTFAAPTSVGAREKVVSRSAVAFTKTRAVMTLHFVPQAAGALVLSGEFKFSVCTDDRCLVEHEALALKLRVKSGWRGYVGSENLTRTADSDVTHCPSELAGFQGLAPLARL